MLRNPESGVPKKDAPRKKRTVRRVTKPVEKKESQRNTPESVETKAVDFVIELLLSDPGCEKMAEGANGVIMKVDITRLSPETRKTVIDALPELGDFDSDTAIKILKILSRDMILNEFARHREAHEIISRSPDRGVVDVPRPRLARAIGLSPGQAADKCRESGIKISKKHPEVACEIMDYIDGEDLELHLCKQLIRARKDLFKKRYPDKNSDQELEKFLDLLDGSNNLRHYMEMIFGEDVGPEARRDTFGNQEIYFEFLKKQMSYREFFTKEQAAAFKRTLDLLHGEGFYHRDLHLRNVMIDKQGKFYIIDFDRSLKINPQDEQIKSRIYFKDPEQNVGTEITKVFPDGWMVDFFEQVSKNADDKKQEMEELLAGRVGAKDVADFKKKAESAPNSDLGRAWEKAKQGIAGNQDLKNIIDGLLLDLRAYGTWGSDNAKLWLGVLLEAAESGRQGEVIDFCRRIINNKDTNNFVRSKLSALLEYL